MIVSKIHLWNAILIFSNWLYLYLLIYLLSLYYTNKTRVTRHCTNTDYRWVKQYNVYFHIFRLSVIEILWKNINIRSDLSQNLNMNKSWRLIIEYFKIGCFFPHVGICFYLFEKLCVTLVVRVLMIWCFCMLWVWFVDLLILWMKQLSFSIIFLFEFIWPHKCLYLFWLLQ